MMGRPRFKFVELVCSILFTLFLFACAKGTRNDNIKVYRSYTTNRAITPTSLVQPPPTSVSPSLQISQNTYNLTEIFVKTDKFPTVYNPIRQSENSYNKSFGKHEARKIEAIVPIHPKTQFFAEKVSRAIAPLMSLLALWGDRCASWTRGQDQGTCYSRSECLAKGGSPRGICAGGFGICCIFAYSCNTRTTLNRTYFVNPEYPNAVLPDRSLKCKHAVAKLDGICQLRLDFEQFDLHGPHHKNGLCLEDVLAVEGIDYRLPPLCGDLTGHHVYLPIGFAQEVSYFITLNPGRPGRRWKIRTTKIKCYAALMAPGGCLQYHRGVGGRMTSFNYGEDGELPNINRLNYGVCVRREKGFCAIQWSKCTHRRKRSTTNTSQENHTSSGSLPHGKSEKTVSWIPKSGFSVSSSDKGRMTPRMPSIHQHLVNLSWNQTQNFNPKPVFRCPPGNFSWDQLTALFNWTHAENRSLLFDDDNHTTSGVPTLVQLRSCLLHAHNPERHLIPNDLDVSSDSFNSISPLRQRHLSLVHNEGVSKSPKVRKVGTVFLRKAHVSPVQLKSVSLKRMGIKEEKVGAEIKSDPPIFPPRTRLTSASATEGKPLKYHTPILPPVVVKNSQDDAKVKVQQQISNIVHKGVKKDTVIKLKLKNKQASPLLVQSVSKPSKIKLANKVKVPVFEGQNKVKGPSLGGNNKAKVPVFGGNTKVKRPLFGGKTKVKGPIFGGKIKNKNKAKVKPFKNKVKVSKVKPKPTKPYKPHKKQKKGCKKFIPFPFPIAIPFPLGGGGGGDDEDGHDGWGWSSDKIISDIEPYLIRVVTDDKKEDGLKPICLEWEQIPCDSSSNHHHPHFFSHPFHEEL